MVEKSWVWRIADADAAADVDVDADALGTKAWEVDADAARRKRTVRALLLTIMVLVDFGVCIVLRSWAKQYVGKARDVASSVGSRENAAADLSGGGGQTGCIFGTYARLVRPRLSPLSWRATD